MKLIKTTKILNIIYILIVLFFLLDSLTSFDIRNQGIKSFIYFAFLIGTPLTFIWNLFAIKNVKKRIVGLAFPTMILFFIFIIGSMRILFSTGAWRTQKILYQNEHVSFKTIEFQMQDMGSLGYNKRTVEVFYLTPFFIIASEVPNGIEKRVEWVKVDKEVNELGLKFP